ncbi:uncharacterized protein [Coffea arabica]|uniref:Uncharacterized protein isoform X1 n=2 Tax=Coffea arabica TaxID=13443 RepID=A0ABM4V0Y3_COFAR
MYLCSLDQRRKHSSPHYKVFRPSATVNLLKPSQVHFRKGRDNGSRGSRCQREGVDMAFVNRISNVLKLRVSRHMNLELSASNSSLYQTIRSMSSSKLFVGGLSYNTDETSLKEAFSQHGEVVEARIIMDRDHGNSRGFGFVTYASSEEASAAIQAFDGQDLHGRRIRVNYANDRPRAPRFSGGYGGGGSGFNYGRGNGGYGGPGGYASGSYGGGGPRGGYDSGNYGNSNQYASGDGRMDGFSGSNYGSRVGDGNAGNFGASGDSHYLSSDSSNQGGFANSGFDGNTSPYGQAQEQLSGNQGGADALDEDFGQDTLNANYKDNDDDEDDSNDYVNTRG